MDRVGETWFPGQMARTRRLIRENLPLVGLVVEVVDARAPQSTSYPHLSKLVSERPILTVLGKADLADPSATRHWVEYLRSRGRPGDSAVAFACGSERDAREVAGLAEKLGRGRGPTGQMRAMVVGMPNVGKSTLINRLVGRASARTGDRPGITRGKQWLKVAAAPGAAAPGAAAPGVSAPGTGAGLALLDLPGILVPGRLPVRVALTLALLGLLPDRAFDARTVANHALTVLRDAGGLDLFEGSKTADSGTTIRPVSEREALSGSSRTTEDLISRYALARGHLRTGGLPDEERAAAAIIKGFRESRFGRLTLELPRSEGDGPA